MSNKMTKNRKTPKRKTTGTASKVLRENWKKYLEALEKEKNLEDKRR